MNYIFQWIAKRQAMVSIFIIGLACFTNNTKGAVDLTKNLDTEGYNFESNRSNHIFRAQRVKGNYLFYLKKLFSLAQSNGGSELDPAEFPRVAIKISTANAPGLQVSPFLVNALLSILHGNGYNSANLYLVDREQRSLIRGGFLSSVDESAHYRGHRVIFSNHLAYYDSAWVHDSPMPPTIYDRIRFFNKYPLSREKRLEEERKSYLPRILFGKDTFWINLSVAMDSLNLGIDGACANLSTGAISNHKRFLNKSTIAPATVTEILAIPEIWNKRTYSIIDLSRYQFANGGRFDAEFLGRESTLLLSENPFSVDRVALQTLNASRKEYGFLERKADELLLFRYAKELGLGDVDKSKIYDVR
ncbi:MAG: hypothetical protein P8O23_10995 [Opitutales bacterium]|nr:hypothetical protein [Opitutales bacterium]